MRKIRVIAVSLMFLFLLCSCSNPTAGESLKQCKQAYDEIFAAKSLHYSVRHSFDPDDDRACQNYEAYYFDHGCYYNNSGIFVNTEYAQWGDTKYLYTEDIGKWVEMTGSQAVTPVFTLEWEKYNFTFVDSKEENDQVCITLKTISEINNKSTWKFFLNKDGKLTYLEISTPNAVFGQGSEALGEAVNMKSEYTFYDDSLTEIQHKILEVLAEASTEAESESNAN